MSIFIFRWNVQKRAAALYRVKMHLANNFDQSMLLLDACFYALLAARSVRITYSVYYRVAYRLNCMWMQFID